MKIATTTSDFGGYCKNDIERIRELHRAGFRYIDLNMYSFKPDSPYMQENWREAVQELKELGIRETVMLTGDRQAPAQEIQEALGIDRVYAQLLPQDKLEKLRQLSAGEHNVLAVGDGINDALALREADVGIAMGAMGSDVAIESADIALMNNNLMNIPFVMDLARRTRKVIYQNLVLSISISVVMIALSAFGVISALAGSILHNFGAFAVLLNSSRILREEEES